MSSLDEMYAQKQRMLDEMRGASQERKAIVAWLLSLTDPGGVIVIDIDDIELIERGDHLVSDDE